ncbi:hypothetical protein B0A48_05231 [Cryoendolithus antarcticus]|uniref:Heterokaryon incompatibility domain-containing protein n=1 Tax=Cryoendolithus antarcticus TaxID=1507870 RepID=A0A1V8THY8_9PEZI|nr:hypothetical protein B0A48_05231 [Cryoendolithus antarcticus]
MAGNETWYEPLLRSRHLFWTRFLALEAGQGEEPLACELIPDATVDEVDYEALSYVWGTSTVTCSIIVNGLSGFTIRKNLNQAPHRLRLPDRPRLLWVDAICINQMDPLEKAFQVAHMDDVYRHAERVLVWLGDCSLYYPDLWYAAQKVYDADEWSRQKQDMQNKVDAGTSKVGSPFETEIQSLVRMAPFDESIDFRYTRAPSPQRLGIADAVRSAYDLLLLPTCDPPVPQALAHELRIHMTKSIAKNVATDKVDEIFWWNRVWVIQELLLARSIVVHCGPYEMSWEDCQAVFAHDLPMASLDSLRRQFKINKSRAKASAAAKGAHGLLALLRATVTNLASNPLDKIYAIMHLTQGDGEYRVQPDYTAKPRDVFAAAALHCIVSTSTFDILFHPFFRFTTEVGVDGRCSSWIPDLSQKPFGSGYRWYEKPYQGRWTHSVPSRDRSFAKDDPGGYPTDWTPRCGQFIDFLEGLSPPANILTRHKSHTTIMYLAMTNAVRWWPRVENTGTNGPLSRHSFENGKEEASRLLSETVGASPDQRNNSMWASQFFVTEQGLVGFGPEDVKTGDVVAVVSGAHVPWLLRPVGREYSLLGDAYVHGLMRGAVRIKAERGEMELEEFVLL